MPGRRPDRTGRVLGRAAAGRFVVSGVLLALPARVLPVLTALMAGARLVVPAAASARGGVLVFALGGLGCSAVFPLTVGLAGRRFPAHRTWVLRPSSPRSWPASAWVLSTGLLREWLEPRDVYRLAALPPILAAAFRAAGDGEARRVTVGDDPSARGRSRPARRSSRSA